MTDAERIFAELAAEEAAMLDTEEHVDEWRQAQIEGAAAFGRGEPVSGYLKLAKHGWNWKIGWEGAKAAKIANFYDYLKFRDLYEAGYLPLHARHNPRYADNIHRVRARKIEKLQQRYPDFPAAYARHLEWKKGASK